MIVNGMDLLDAAPIKDMLVNKVQVHGVSYGLTEAGYDIRLKQAIHFIPDYSINFNPDAYVMVDNARHEGNFVLGSAVEEFQMPPHLVGIVHDKSTWARHGLSVFNTVIEPGWRGFLTLELVYHGRKQLILPAGVGIAQVIFHQVANPAAYAGKYQDQEDGPVGPSFKGL